MNLFGKAKTVPKADTGSAVIKMKEHIQSMEKRGTYIEKKIADQLEVAKERTRKKDKRGALMALKKKKLFETERNNLQNSQFQLEQQIMTMEGARTNMETVKAMKQGATAMQNMQAEIGGVESIDDTMDDVREQMDLANEIAEAVSTGMGNDFEDDEDIEAEWDALQQEDTDIVAADMGTVPTTDVVPAFPDVPTTAPVASADAAAAAELAELEAMMAA